VGGGRFLCNAKSIEGGMKTHRMTNNVLSARLRQAAMMERLTCSLDDTQDSISEGGQKERIRRQIDDLPEPEC
jgi:hypothetical protein